MISRSVLDSVRCGVCAIGYSRIPLDDYVGDPHGPHFVIAGTGFLVRDDVVLTNRHVINRPDAVVAAEGLGEERRFLRFDVPRPGGAPGFLSSLGRVGMLNSKTRDLAVVTFAPDSTGLFERCSPARFSPRLRVHVGQPVASVGYVAGINALERETDAGTRLVYRIGPVLQQGYVSALAPHDDNPYIDRILLDLRSREGLSGSLVFDPTNGTVLGILTSGLEAVTAFAEPVTTPIVDYFVGLLRDSQAEGTLAAQVPRPEQVLNRQ